jgi:four helix bundle protein
VRSIDLKDRTKSFAHRCVKLAISLPKSTLGIHVRGQLIRSATSVAANYRAACLAQTKAGFIAKLSIVIEEVDETYFWMEFVVDENLLSQEMASALIQEAKELTSILIASRKTAKKREDKKS